MQRAGHGLMSFGGVRVSCVVDGCGGLCRSCEGIVRRYEIGISRLRRGVRTGLRMLEEFAKFAIYRVCCM